MQSESYARRLAKGSATVFVGLVVANVIAFLLRMFLTRTISITDYGIFYTVFGLVSIFTIFRGVSISSSLAKYIPEFVVKGQYGKIKSSITLVLIVYTVSAFLIALPIFMFSDEISLALFNTAAAGLPLRILSGWFFLSGFYLIFQAAFRGFQDAGAYASIEAFHMFFVFISTFLLVGFWGYGVEGVALAYLFASLAMILIFAPIFFKRHSRILKEKILITRPLAKELFRYGIPIFIIGIWGLILGYMNTLMLAIFRSPIEVSYFQTAQPAANILEFFSAALGVVLLPMISELWTKGERGLLNQALHFLTKFSFLFVIPFVMIFIAFPENVLLMLFGPDYLAGAVALQVLAGSAIVYIIYRILVNALFGVGKPGAVARTVGVMAGSNIVANLLLIPTFGVNGAAAAVFLSYALGLAMMLYYTRKFIKFTVPFGPLLKMAVGAVLTLLIIFGLKTALVLPPWPETVAVMMPSLLFYGAWVIATKAITRSDLGLINRIVPMPKWLVRAIEKLVRS